MTTRLNTFYSESVFRRDYGGLNSNVNGRQGNEVYFIGIIDILTLFDLKKKAEHVLKTVKNFDNVSIEIWHLDLKTNPDQKNISAIPPAPYKERFLNYCSTIFV